MNPLVTVIVTTSNREKLLTESIDSICAQTYGNFELIVVDNYSNYDFLGLMGRYNDSRISFFQNIDNGIIALNRNFALKKAKGEYIAFCDDDDTWEPTKLEVQLKEAEKHESHVLIYTNATCFGEGIKPYPITTQKKQIADINDLFKHNSITLSSVLVSKSDIVFFDELKELRAAEDYFLWLNLIYHNYKVVFIDLPLVNYRISKNSASNLNSKFGHLRFLLSQNMLLLRYSDIKFSKINLFTTTMYSMFKFLIKYYLYSEQGKTRKS